MGGVFSLGPFCLNWTYLCKDTCFRVIFVCFGLQESLVFQLPTRPGTREERGRTLEASTVAALSLVRQKRETGSETRRRQQVDARLKKIHRSGRYRVFFHATVDEDRNGNSLVLRKYGCKVITRVQSMKRWVSGRAFEESNHEEGYQY